MHCHIISRHASVLGRSGLHEQRVSGLHLLERSAAIRRRWVLVGVRRKHTLTIRRLDLGVGCADGHPERCARLLLREHRRRQVMAALARARARGCSGGGSDGAVVSVRVAAAHWAARTPRPLPAQSHPAARSAGVPEVPECVYGLWLAHSRSAFESLSFLRSSLMRSALSKAIRSWSS